MNSLFTFVACISFVVFSAASIRGQAQNGQPIRVLIIDGFSNHDWKQTTAVTRWILEKSGRFAVDVSTIPADSTQRSRWLPHLSAYTVVIQNTNNIHNPSLRWPRQAELALEDRKSVV